MQLSRFCPIFILFLGLGAFPAHADPLLSQLSIAGHEFMVETATTPAEQNTGLMYRRSLAPDQGMIFVFPDEQDTAMWMKNTLIRYHYGGHSRQSRA